MRYWRYHVYLIARFWPFFILAPFTRRFLDSATSATFEGIKVVDASLRREIDQSFRVNTIAALELIKSVDPRRFRRVQREIKIIVNSESTRWASYSRPLQGCDVDYSRMDGCKPLEWSQWVYATVLVHEATHGAIYSRHVAYTKALRVRIERLCVTEAKRFARKADSETRQWSSHLVRDFDERNWHESWHSTFLQRASRLTNRMREAHRNLPKKG